MINRAYFSFTTTGDNRIYISVPNIMYINFIHRIRRIVITYTTGDTSNFDFIEQKYFDNAYDTWNDISYTIGNIEANKAMAYVPLQAYDEFQTNFDLPF